MTSAPCVHAMFQCQTLPVVFERIAEKSLEAIDAKQTVEDPGLEPNVALECASAYRPRARATKLLLGQGPAPPPPPPTPKKKKKAQLTRIVSNQAVRPDGASTTQLYIAS